MLTEPLTFVKLYLNDLNQSLEQLNGKLTRTQTLWLGFCLTAIILTNSVCWKAWERWSGGKYTDSALSWMFRNSLIPWNKLLTASLGLILKKYKIKEGVLALDDSDHQRSKKTKKIGYAHRIKDKKHEGYFNGQNMVFLVIITDKITIPCGFAFYQPDPDLKKWEKQDKQLRKDGIKKQQRPKKPSKNKKYPTKLEIAYSLLDQFFKAKFDIKIRCIVADAFYGSAEFVEKASQLNNRIQVISQIRSNQLVRNERGLLVEVSQFFKNKKTVKKQVSIRGGDNKVIIMCVKKLYIEAHGVKRSVIAVKYSEEKEYRYIIATDMSWQALDIVRGYTLRWLIEVFFEDWKMHEGWANLAKQQGDEGSSRGVILSLLLDHSLLFHDIQQPCIENKLPLNTIGSLIETSKMQIIYDKIDFILHSDAPYAEFQALKDSLQHMMPKRCSEKHMCHRGFKDVFLEAA